MGLFSSIAKVLSPIPIVGDLASGAADFLDSSTGDLLSGGASYLGQAQANSANKALSREQMAFQERMSSTAHQREVKDLIAAGLNPMLSGTGGSGASSPAGSMAIMQNAAEKGVNSAQAAKQLRINMEQMQSNLRQTSAAIDNLNAQSGKAIADTVNTNADTHLTQQLEEKAKFDTVAAAHSARAAALNADLLNYQIPAARNAAAAEQSDFKKYVSPYLSDVGKVAGSLSSARAAMSRDRTVTHQMLGGDRTVTHELVGGERRAVEHYHYNGD